MTPKKVFKDERAPAYALLAAALKAYGTDVLSVEPALIRDQIRKDYDVEISQLQSDKIQGAITIMTTDQFENDWLVFQTICNVFSNEQIDGETINPAEAEEIVVALVEFGLIRSDIEGESGKPIEYSDDVRAYAGRMFYDYGFTNPPEIFPSAIMPSHESDPGGERKNIDDVKNDALNELFAAHVNYVVDYLDGTAT